MANKKKNVLTVGDTVIWNGGFGSDAKIDAKIVGIEHTKGGKYGEAVDSIPWSQVYDRNVCVDLDNGHWAYANQIKQKNV